MARGAVEIIESLVCTTSDDLLVIFIKGPVKVCSLDCLPAYWAREMFDGVPQVVTTVREEAAGACVAWGMSAA